MFVAVFALPLLIATGLCILTQGKHITNLPTPKDYEVQDLKKYGVEDETYAGLMPITWTDDVEGSFFFWLAKQRKSKSSSDKKEKEKLVVWLNGGPGCSSMVGMFWENGPFHIQEGDKHSKLKYNLPKNPYSWNEVANVLYVEQPIRTGFAQAAVGAETIRNERQIARDFRNFLISFMKVFPEFKGAELVLTGESYAGAYIPWIAEHIVEQQLVPLIDSNTIDDFYYSVSESEESKHERHVGVDGINLVGVAIGNGVIDYLHQEPSYAEYAYYHGLIPLGAKQKIDYDFQLCLKQIQEDGVPPTRGSFDRCNTMSKVLEAAGLPNEYNTATFKSYSYVLDPSTAFQKFFQDPEVQEALHVRGYNLPGLIFEPELPKHMDAITQDDDAFPHGAADAESHHHNVHHHHHHNHEDDDRGGTHFHHDYDDAVADDHGDDSDDFDDDDDDTYKGVYFKPPLGWQVCNDELNDQMRADHPVSIVPTLQFLAEAPPVTDSFKAKNGENRRGLAEAVRSSVRVLLYSGEFDLNCNTLGTLHTLEANTWIGRAWNEAARSLWYVDGDVAGEYFTMDEIFSFLIVRNSGHLLPMDLPKIGLELLNRFLHNETFADKSLPNEAYYIRELEKMQQADSEGAASPIMSGERGVSLVITVLLTALALALFLYTVYHLRPKIFKNDYSRVEGDLSAMAIEHSLKPSMGNFVNSAFQTRTNDANIEMGVLVSGRAESNEINAAGTVQHSFSRFEPQRFTETADESTRLQQRSYYQQL